MSTATVTRARPWAYPDARLLLPADAPRPDWLAERRGGIGGSDASTIAGVNRWGSRYELWLDKTGRLPEQPETPAMRMGRLLEPVVAQMFTEDTGIRTRRAGLMASRTRPWQRVSLDDLTEDGGILECKTTNWRLADEWDDGQVADHAEVQVQHALAVTGRTHAWVAVLIDGRDFRFERVERNDHLIEVLTDMEDRFWRDHILADVAPAMEANALEAVKDLYAGTDLDLAVTPDAERVRAIIARRAAAKAAEKAARADADVAEAELLAEISGAQILTAPDGRVLATWKTTKRAGYTVAPIEYRRLHIPKEK